MMKSLPSILSVIVLLPPDPARVVFAPLKHNRMRYYSLRLIFGSQGQKVCILQPTHNGLKADSTQ